MKITNQHTIYTGTQALFPEVRRAVRAFLPNLDAVLELASDLNASRLERAGRWQYHVLKQLTFSYLSCEYLATTVQPVLDNLADAASLQTLLAVQHMVRELTTGRIPLTHSSAANLNDAAHAFFAEIAQKRLEIIVEAMNAIGRFGCGTNAGGNPSRTRKFFNLLVLALNNHCREMYFCRRIREEFSFGNYSDGKSLRASVLSALTHLRDDLARSTTVLCIFHCPDIKLSAENFSIGAVTFVHSNDPKLAALLTSSGDAPQWLAARSNPWEAMALLGASCHPEDPHTGLANAAADFEEITGQFAANSGSFAPPRQYAGIAPDGSQSYPVCEQSAKPGSSLLLIRANEPAYFTMLHDRFIAPALSTPVEPALQERFRRALRTIRRAAFLAHCGEYSQAFASAWQVLEAIFGGVESRERGHAIARRVSVMVVMPDGERADEEYPVRDEDLIQFAAEYLASSNAPLPGTDMANILTALTTLTPGDPQLAIYQTLLRDLNDELMDWYEARRAMQISQRSEEEVKERLFARRIELKDRLEQHYKLRNDIVHAGYDDEGVAEVMYSELARLLGSFIYNLAFNCIAKKSYAALLESLDEEWQRGWPQRDLALAADQMKVAAYYRWLARGRPVGDDWADWFGADHLEAK